MPTALLLQGPVGPFFAGLTKELRQRGYEVVHVVFNGADEMFADPAARLRYRGTDQEWPLWLTHLLAERGFERVFLFGDCRPLHREAIRVCRERSLPVHVVEEGYLRPFYLTIETGGVNGFSPLPRDAAAYRAQPPTVGAPRSFRWVFPRRAFSCIAFYWAMLLRRGLFPHYRHYREANPIREGLYWFLSFNRWLRFKWLERNVMRDLSGKRFFLIPLQVHGDTQISFHSQFASVAHFLVKTVASFAAHAPADTLLVIKHHPMDRAYRDYGRLIAQMAERYKLHGRLVYVHDTPVPQLLRQTAGVVVINSTVGMSALNHAVPVKTLGDAVYAQPGLTSRQPLEQFWRRPSPVDMTLFRRFRAHLLARTQLNGTSAHAEANWSLLDRIPGLGTVPAPQPEQDRRVTPATVRPSERMVLGFPRTAVWLTAVLLPLVAATGYAASNL